MYKEDPAQWWGLRVNIMNLKFEIWGETIDFCLNKTKIGNEVSTIRR